jgi:uncharacterized protein
MPFQNPTPGELRAFLQRIRTIAVLGLSPDPDRPSFSVASYLQEQGYRIVPVRPGGGTLLGEKVYESLTEVPFAVDVVDVFRASRFVAAHVEEALAARAGAVWLQEGVIDEEAAARARAAGLFVAMDLCMLKEHRRAAIGRIR